MAQLASARSYASPQLGVGISGPSYSPQTQPSSSSSSRPSHPAHNTYPSHPSYAQSSGQAHSHSAQVHRPAQRTVHGAGGTGGGGGGGGGAAQPQQIPAPYAVTAHELLPTPRNRLFLALKSDIDSEVEWCLPKLVVGSYLAGEYFALAGHLDSVPTLLRWPGRWIKSLEEIGTQRAQGPRSDDMDIDGPGPLSGGLAGENRTWSQSRAGTRTATTASWPTSRPDVTLEKRATECLLILRNAASSRPQEPGKLSNAEYMTRSDLYLDLVIRFFSLPEDMILETAMESPEVVSHILTLLTFTLPFLPIGSRSPSASIALIEDGGADGDAPGGAGQTGSGSGADATGTGAGRRPGPGPGKGRGATRGEKLGYIFGRVLPRLLVQSRDRQIVNLVFPLLINTLSLPQIPCPDPELVSYLLNLITLRSPTSSPLTLELALDLLVTLTLPSPSSASTQNQPQLQTASPSANANAGQGGGSSANCIGILSSPRFPSHLKNLVQLLEHGAKSQIVNVEQQPHVVGRNVKNPAHGGMLAEEGSRRRGIERERMQVKVREAEAAKAAAAAAAAGSGGAAAPTVAEVGRVEGSTTASASASASASAVASASAPTGDKPPALSSTMRNKLYVMAEPKRSIAWMHETFVYSSTSQLLQVTFWHAYRDFFQHSKTVDPLLSASEVIRNVTVAFPGAMAKAYTDEMGQSRFVIAGMGFRQGSEDEDRFLCLWKGCEAPPTATNPAELLSHIQSVHLAPELPASCAWATCTHSPFTLSHLVTHLPNPVDMPGSARIPEYVSTHQAMPEDYLSSPHITAFPPAPLGPQHKLQFHKMNTPTVPHHHPQQTHVGGAIAHDRQPIPTGTTFLSALIIRNLARYLRTEIQSSLPLTEEGREEKKKHLVQERFGLPIPDSVLLEEEEEERAARGGGGGAGEGEMGLNQEERERAKGAFEVLEERVGEVVDGNVCGLGQYLVDALGW